MRKLVCILMVVMLVFMASCDGSNPNPDSNGGTDSSVPTPSAEISAENLTTVHGIVSATIDSGYGTMVYHRIEKYSDAKGVLLYEIESDDSYSSTMTIKKESGSFKVGDTFTKFDSYENEDGSSYLTMTDAAGKTYDQNTDLGKAFIETYSSAARIYELIYDNSYPSGTATIDGTEYGLTVHVDQSTTMNAVQMSMEGDGKVAFTFEEPVKGITEIVIYTDIVPDEESDFGAVGANMVISIDGTAYSVADADCPKIFSLLAGTYFG